MKRSPKVRFKVCDHVMDIVLNVAKKVSIVG